MKKKVFFLFILMVGVLLMALCRLPSHSSNPATDRHWVPTALGSIEEETMDGHSDGSG